MTGWTDAQIPDLSGRTAVVTGANSGLGWQTARQLAAHGARVRLACRDRARGEDAVRRLHELLPGAELSLGLLDLADLASVRAFVAELLATDDRLDLLINNAGVMAIPQRRTADGFEMQIGTNHLGHFALTGLLLPALLATPGARVVTVSSTVHRLGRIDARDPLGARRYRRWTAYGRSKLANLLFAFELDRRLRRAGEDLVSAAAHPGFAATNLQTAGARMRGNRVEEVVMRLGNALFAQSDAAGAWPSLYAATHPDVVGGMFIGPTGPAESRGYPGPVTAARAARDEHTAARLWTRSEEVTKVTFPLPGPG